MFQIKNGILKKYIKQRGVAEVVIPDSVTSIGTCAFQGCWSLTSITIPDSVASIGDRAFENCSSLTSITIPDSVASIGAHTFKGCSNLTSITIPDSVTSIGALTFKGCSSLTSIIIPDSVTSVGAWAFFSCRSLTDIYVKIKNQIIKLHLDGHLDDNTWQKMRILAKEKIKNSISAVPVDSDNENIEVKMLRKKYQQAIQKCDDIKCKYDQLKVAYDSINQEFIIFKKKYEELENRIRAAKRHTFCTFFELSEKDKEDLLKEHVEL